MDRRDFLKVGSQTVIAGSLATSPAGAEPNETPTAAPSLLRTYTQEDHRQRLQNIGIATRAIRSCMRKHFITDYLPAQCCYNLGEYPARTPWNPSDYDEQELDHLKAHGVQILQVFDDWNDSLRLFGGDKYSPVNPAGYRRFIDMAHRRGMKVLTYTSPCFLQRTDPDFRPEWSREGDFLVVGYWDMARCSPASPGWRAFVLPKFDRIMDEYGSDGLYLDGGYLANQHEAKRKMPLAKDEIEAFEETPQYDGAFTDLLALIHAEVKRRGGILKLHVNAAEQPQSDGLRLYDYLWVGEGVSNADQLRESVKDYQPYVIPCLDMGFTTIQNEDEPYLHAIPYLQFPVMQGGHIFTGERGMIPGIKYNDDFWMQRCRDAWKQYQIDPAKLHTYSAWDAVPGNPETRQTHASWLKSYLPLVEDGTWAWLEVHDSDLFTAPPPPNLVASVFANRRLHLVLANCGQETVTVQTKAAYRSARNPKKESGNQWEIGPRSLDILIANPATPA